MVGPIRHRSLGHIDSVVRTTSHRDFFKKGRIISLAGLRPLQCRSNTQNKWTQTAISSFFEGGEESLGTTAGGFGEGMVSSTNWDEVFNKTFDALSKSGEEFFWGAFGGGNWSFGCVVDDYTDCH
jgi:hypothetical protein